MSEDSNLPTPPPSPEERPVQPEAESFDGGLDGDSWLLDVGPEPGTEYEEHESVPALPMEWDEGSPSAEWEQGAEAPAAAPAFAEGFEVFEESEAYGEFPEGYEEFGDGGETSFIEPAPRSRPMVEAILPGTLAMLLSFAGIAVWSFLRTPASFNENVELARSEHEIHFTPDHEVELAKPLQLPTTGPADDRVAGWMELGQTAGDLSEPDELGYASSATDDGSSYASVPTGPESTVVTTVEPVTPEEEEASPEPAPEALTVLEALGAAEPASPEPAAPEAMVSVVAVEDEGPAPDAGSAAVDTAAADTAAADTAEPEAAEPEAVATLEPMVEPAEQPAQEPTEEPAEVAVEETPAPGALQEFLLGVAGWSAVAVELAAESEADVASLPESFAPRPFQGPGCVPAPLELMSDGPLEQVAVADAPEAEGASAPGPEAETEPETEPGSFTPGWLMALVAPAAPGAEGTTEDAPTVAQLSLPEPEVDTVMEEPAVAPEPFDWTERTWGPEVTMSAVELPEVEEPYEPRVVEIEVPGAVEDEVATLAEPANEQVALPEEILIAEAPVAEGPITEVPATEAPATEAPAAEATGVAALGWPSDWPSPWEAEAPAQAWTPEPAMEPVPTQVAEAVEPVEEAIVADEVAAAEFTGIEEAPMEQAEVPAPAVVAEPAVEVAAIPEQPSIGDEPVGTSVNEEPALEEIHFEELASADPVTEGPMPEEDASPEPAAQEPMVEVAAAEPPPVPQVNPGETSLEALPLTGIGWPSDWPMAWDAEPVQVAEPEAVAAAEAVPAEVQGTEALALDAEPQATEPTAAPEEPADPAPVNELVAAAEEPAPVTEEVAAEAVDPVTEPATEPATEPTIELAAAEAPAPLDELDGEVAQAAAPEEVDEQAEVAMVGPALPQFAPVLVPPSPDLVSDLNADPAGGDPAAGPGGAPAGVEVAASIPAAAGAVEAEFESVSSAGTIAQQEVAVEVVGSLAEEAPTRRRRQLLERIEDERYWRFKSVPSRKFNDDDMVFTPNVGNVRVVLKGGEAFDGRLHSVGQGKIMLDTKMGRMAVDARRADRVDRITDDRSVLRGPATTASTSGLKRVKVRTDGGVFYGHLVSREGKRVTLLMDEGFRITLESDDVTEAADRRGGRLRRVDQR